MGGFGSGRPGSGRVKAKSCRTLDVNLLHREGCLGPGAISTCEWNHNGAPAGDAELRAGGGFLHLSYCVRVGDSDWQNVEDIITIVRTPCWYGGSRPYFLCLGCGRRVAKLFLRASHFRCRHCYQLSYTSQSEDKGTRALRRARKICARLGGEPEVSCILLRRPKGMHKATFERLVQLADDYEAIAEEALFASPRWTP